MLLLFPKEDDPKEEYKSLNLEPKLKMSLDEDREEFVLKMEELLLELLSPTILEEKDPNASEDLNRGDDLPWNPEEEK